MTGFGILSVLGLLIYALLGVLSVVLMIFSIQLVFALTRLVRKLTAYWHMKTEAQHEAMRGRTENRPN